MEKFISKSFERLAEKGVNRGFITHDELQKSLGKRNSNIESLEKAILHIFDLAVTLVKQKSDFKIKKKEQDSSKTSKSPERSDDPIRMYLREMGGVELLSREGEIAIAKRIESGKYVMVSSLSESPITANKIFEWEKKLINNEMLVRDIIDLDTNFLDDEKLAKTIKEKNKKQIKLNNEAKKDANENKKEDNENENNENEADEEDEYNISLASLEIELKPKILETFNKITKNYKKLTSYQKEKLEAVLKNESYSESKKKNYERIKKEIMEEMLGLQFNQTTQEDLVNLNYTQNKKALSFDGELMRAATKYGISREDFIKFYVGNELNPNFENFLSEDKTWQKFFKTEKKLFNSLKEKLIALSKEIGMSISDFKILVNKIKKGERESRIA